MNQFEDAELRALFAELREHDGVSCPEFDAMGRRAGTGRHRLPSARAAAMWVTAAACLLAGIGFIVKPWRSRETTRLVSAPSISTWRSPTAALLRTPARDLLAPRPILSSVLDGTTRIPIQTKGDGS